MTRHPEPYPWLLIVAIALAAALVAPGQAAAQRDRPQPTPDPRVRAAAGRYAARHVIPALSPPTGASASGELRVTNAGWLTTTVAILELGAPPAQDGCQSPVAPVVGARCLDAVGPLSVESVAPRPEATSVWIYSLDPARSARACQALTQLDSASEHEAWARDHWWPSPGEPLATVWVGTAAAGRAASSGLPATGVREILGGVGGPQAAVLPYVGPEGRAHWVNAESDCLGVTARSGEGQADAACPPLARLDAELPPLAVRDPLALVDTTATALAGQGRGELLAVADLLDGGGWSSYSAGSARRSVALDRASTAFPVVISPLGESEAELWVTNQHVTRTARITLLMWDGNQDPIVPHIDPVVLCAGASRRYDIRALAGDIPPTNANRRGDVNVRQPPYLSLRVESVSEDGSVFLPVAAMVRLSGVEGTGAYGGLNLPLLSAASVLRGDGAVRGTPPMVTIVPDVHIGYGPRRISTFLATMTIAPSANAERQALVDLYDEHGRRVAESLRISMGSGPGGFLDLALVGSRLGDRFPGGFRGTAVVRGSLNRGAIGVVALNRPAGTDAPPPLSDDVTVHPGIVVARGPDPSVPTATPRPTRLPPSPTPGRGRGTPTAEPSPVAPFAPLYLPYLWDESLR